MAFRKEDTFELPVDYLGKEWLLPAKLVQTGYTYKIFVQAESTEIVFEPDEERNFRAVVMPDIGKEIPVAFVKAIGEALERNFH